MALCVACDDQAPAQDTEAGVESGVEVGEAGVEAGEAGTQALPLDPLRCVTYSYDPARTRPQTFPDDYLTLTDEGRRTGLRLAVADLPWVEEQSAFVKKLMGDLDSLDGWGINAGLILRFSGPIEGLPSGPETGEMESPVKLLRLDGVDEPPLYTRQVAVELRALDEGGETGEHTLVFEPMRPLKPATRYALVIEAQGEGELSVGGEAGCLATAEAMDLLTSGALDAPEHPYVISEAYAEAFELAGLSPQEVAAATVFTTQSEPEVSRSIASKIRNSSYTWLDEPSCDEEGDRLLCTRSFMAQDFRDEGVVDGPVARDEHPIKVYFWKPKNRIDARPTILYGHGIGGDVDNAYGLLNMMRDDPVSLIAIDAVAHGEHPDAPRTLSGEVNSAQVVFTFFALNIPTQTIDGLKARDNFRQSTYEKLQLIELLHQDPDIDADGRADVDLSRLGYYGLSLGGIMGVELLALEPRLSASLLTVPGARLVSVITDGSLITDFLPVIYNLVGGEATFKAFTPLAQVLLDGADPGSYAPSVLHHRRGEAPPPHLLMQMAINDEVVPNSANRALARALGLPHIGPVAQEVGLLTPSEAPASLNLSLESSEITAGLFQFDRVVRGLNTVTPATHINTPNSREASLQTKSFWRPWLEAEAPSIVDPYDVFGVP
jgi:hypothetical protein